MSIWCLAGWFFYFPNHDTHSTPVLDLPVITGSINAYFIFCKVVPVGSNIISIRTVLVLMNKYSTTSYHVNKDFSSV